MFYNHPRIIQESQIAGYTYRAPLPGCQTRQLTVCLIMHACMMFWEC